MIKPCDLATLVAICDGELVGETRMIQGICSAETPQADHLTFIASKAFLKYINLDSQAIYIVKPEHKAAISSGILHENPTQAFRLIAEFLTHSAVSGCISKTAVVSSTAQIAKESFIGENVVIGDAVQIGAGCYIGANTVIEAGAIIGENTRIEHNASIYQNVQIGKDCVIASGAVIGSQGFGFSFEGGEWKAIPQLGRVVIGNAVHIGANACIDCGAINDTVIGDNVIIDNLVHIAHNVNIGSHTALAGCVGIAGSTTIGKYCLFGGQVGIAGHITICDGVQVNGGANILQSIEEPGGYAGALPALPVTKWNRAIIYFKKLETLFRRKKNSERNA